MQDLPQVPSSIEPGDDHGQGKTIGGSTLEGGDGGDLRAVPVVLELAEKSVEPRLRRRIRGALLGSLSFWKVNGDVLTSNGLDDDATTEKLKRMQHEISQEFAEHPSGTKKLKHIADAFHLSLRNLKLVSEVFNPGCFDGATRKHGLTPGMAFDTLGYDLLCPQAREHVREYIRHMKPGLVLLAPPCHMFSQLQNLSQNKREGDTVLMARYLMKRKAANKLLAFAAEVCHLCLELGLTFVLERPWAAKSWATKPIEQLLRRDDTFISRCDQSVLLWAQRGGQLFTSEANRVSQ